MNIIPYPATVDLSRFAKDVNNPKTLYGLPSEVKFCRSCVISNQRPNSVVEYKHTKDSMKATIHFDEEGTCDACKFAEHKNNKINWDDRDKQLRDLCEKHRKTVDDVRGADSVQCLKERIAASEGVRPEDQRLIGCGIQL